jgi:two-component system, NtrC family, sensor kinase
MRLPPAVSRPVGRRLNMKPTASEQSLNIVILGAGKGGAALIELLTRCAGIQIIGVADSDPSAPGLQLARSLQIPITTDAVAVIASDRANLIVDVTGDPAIPSLIAQHKSPKAEVLGGTAAKLMWSMIQEEQRLFEHLVHAEKLSTLGIFATGIAHEFNNPLHGILGFAQHLQGETDPAAVNEYSQEIIALTRRLSEMTKGLNLYARAGQLSDLLPVQIPQLLDEAVKMAAFSTVLDEVSIVRQYEPVPDMQANPNELNQVFVNLILNAVQAMNARGRLTLATGVEDRNLLVRIQDTGPGIAPQDLAKIFAPFFTTKERGKGTGLGLYVVQTLVKKYGGSIEPISQPGNGTTFRIQFPLAHAA